MQWTSTRDELPAPEVPVWLYDAVAHLGPYIGCRTEDGDGWLWARCNDSQWWDKRAHCWKADNAEDEDDNPTHWMPLPVPPAQSSAG
jgi:hypothetical protein